MTMHNIAVLLLLTFVEHASSRGIDAHNGDEQEGSGGRSVDNLVDGLLDRTLDMSPQQTSAGLDGATLGKSGNLAAGRGPTALVAAPAAPPSTGRRPLHVRATGGRLVQPTPNIYSYSASPTLPNVYRPHFLLVRPHQHPELRHGDAAVRLPEGHFTLGVLGHPEGRWQQTAGAHAAGAVQTIPTSTSTSTSNRVATVSNDVSRHTRHILSQAHTLQEHLGRMSPEHVTEASAVINVLLSVFKIGIGMVAGSTALVADGAHSFSDLISDALCWVSVQLGKRPADASHPHGYGRYEHIGTLGIAGMLFATGAGMALHSGGVLAQMLSGTFVQQRSALEVPALIVAVASVASKELLFRVTYAVGQNHNSPSTVANAYHHRSDALSSLVALVGIGGALMGCLWLDPLAATAVGLMVSWMGLEVAHESIGALSEHMKSTDEFGKFSPA